MLSQRLNIAVGIATVGRREVLSETIELLAQQTRLPDRLVICPVTDKDVDLACLQRFPVATSVVSGVIGCICSAPSVPMLEILKVPKRLARV